MREKIELEVKKIDRILKVETPCDDWMKGRHSAFRGVSASLKRILNEGIHSEARHE